MNEQGLIAEMERLREAVFRIGQRLHARRNLCFNARCQRDAALGIAREVQHQRDVTESEIIRMREANQWIPCRERLPESFPDNNPLAPPKDVLVAHASGAINKGKWIRPHKCWVGCDCHGILQNVTHWRPLPEPPEVSDE